MKGNSGQKFMFIFMVVLVPNYLTNFGEILPIQEIKIKMGCLCSYWTATFLPGEGALPLDSKVISMLVVFSGYKILILIFFRVLWKILCRNEIMVLLVSAHFPYRVKMKSFQKFFSKLEKIVHQTMVRLFN